MKLKYCEPPKDTPNGCHKNRLRILTQEQAELLAARFCKSAFYCTYSNCWHIG